jgi:hypothetical protein
MMTSGSKWTNGSYRHMNVVVAPGSRAEELCRRGVRAARAQPADREAPRPSLSVPAEAAQGLLPSGIDPSPDHNLVDRQGRIIPDLTFTNFFVGGPESWSSNDIRSIDQALAAAMSDRALNNVMVQYFRGSGITSTFSPSKTLPGPAPQTVSKGDVEDMIRVLHDQGMLDGFDFPSTVFNLMLPRGTVLTTDLEPSSQGAKMMARAEAPAPAAPLKPDLKDDDEASSLLGLGGYHGSVNINQSGGRIRVYYAVGVFSERRADGTRNGIPVFDEPWKNVVATFYHELNEARTDPDVEEAIRNNDDRFIGWNSDEGEECGDFPITEAGRLGTLTLVFQEVELTDQSGTVPIQFQYSNFAEGPQGPSQTPDPAQS